MWVHPTRYLGSMMSLFTSPLSEIHVSLAPCTSWDKPRDGTSLSATSRHFLEQTDTWGLRKTQREMAAGNGGIVPDIQQVLDDLLGALRNRFPVFRMVQLLLLPKLTRVLHDQQENLLTHPLLCQPLGGPCGGLDTCTLGMLPRA